MIDRISPIEQDLLSRWPENKLEPTLDRIKELLRLEGDPHLAYPVIHITGTNGKSTTARMIDEILRAHGLRVGRYTSPHLTSVLERIVIDGNSVDPDTFADIFESLRPSVAAVDGNSPIPMSFFEIMTAVALTTFAQLEIDVAVVEVGMGGTWDATNVVNGQVCVITPISLDHTDYLGPDEMSIAREKSGIVKAGSTLVSGIHIPDVTKVFADRAARVGATMINTSTDVSIFQYKQNLNLQSFHLRTGQGDYPGIDLPLIGRHQTDNASTALAAVEAFLESAGEVLTDNTVRAGLLNVQAPGRLELISNSPVTFVDASHNPGGMTASVQGLLEVYNPQYTIVVFSILHGKDIDGILKSLEPMADYLIVTENDSPRSVPAKELAVHARDTFPDLGMEVKCDLGSAVDRSRILATRAGSGALVFVTGSVITAGQARAHIAAADERREVAESSTCISSAKRIR